MPGFLFDTMWWYMDIGSILYYGVLTLWSAGVAYLILEQFFPLILATKKKEETHGNELPHAHDTSRTIPRTYGEGAATPKKPGGFDPNIGFRSYQTGAELTIDDIVAGMSRE